MAKKKTTPAAAAAPVAPPPSVDHIVEPLRRFAVSVDSIFMDPANARVHGERNLAAIQASLKRFGQQKPILFDAARIVRAGSGTLEAARALGWTTIAAIPTNLTAEELVAYAIADNRTGELAEWDAAELTRQLESLIAAGFETGLLEFTAEELDALAQNVEQSLDNANGPASGGGSGTGGGAPPPDQYKILIECRDEAHQTELLDRFDKEGLACKALVQ